MKSQLVTILTLIMAIVMSSCEPQDDIEGIFVGKTWKLSNICNDKDAPTLDNSQVNTINSSSGFTITFSQNTFTATASSQRLEGTWSADNKGNSFTINITRTEGNESSALGNKFIQMLRNCRYYEGDYYSLKLYDENKSEYLLLRPL